MPVPGTATGSEVLAAKKNALSFASIVKGSDKFLSLPKYEPGIRYASKDGCHSVSLSPSDLARGEAFLSNVLILKFSTGRPPIPEIRTGIEAWGLSGDFVLGPVDHRLILLRLSSEDDVSRVLSREKYHVRGYWFRVQRWSTDFDPKRDSVIASVWMLLPDLPWKLFEPTILKGILKKLGKVLLIDEVSTALAKPTAARVSIELDISKHLPERIWISLPSGESFWQKLSYDNPPMFCSHCFLQGHEKEQCRKLIGLKSNDVEISVSDHDRNPKTLVTSKDAGHQVHANGSTLSSPVDVDGFQTVKGKKQLAKQVYKPIDKSNGPSSSTGTSESAGSVPEASVLKVSKHPVNKIDTNQFLGLEKISEGEEGDILMDIDQEKRGMVLIMNGQEKSSSSSSPTEVAASDLNLAAKGVEEGEYRLSKSAKKRLKKRIKQGGTVSVLVEKSKQTSILLQQDENLKVPEACNQSVAFKADVGTGQNIEVRSAANSKDDQILVISGQCTDEITDKREKDNRLSTCIQSDAKSSVEDGAVEDGAEVMGKDSAGSQSADRSEPKKRVSFGDSTVVGFSLEVSDEEVDAQAQDRMNSVCLANPWYGNRPMEKSSERKSSFTLLVPTKLHDGQATKPLVELATLEDYGRDMIPSDDDVSERDCNSEDDDSGRVCNLEDDDFVPLLPNIAAKTRKDISPSGYTTEFNRFTAGRKSFRAVSSPHPKQVFVDYEGFEGTKFVKDFKLQKKS